MAKLNKLAAIVVAALILALGFTTQVSAADAVKYLVVKKLNKKIVSTQRGSLAYSLMKIPNCPCLQKLTDFR